jgi:hypothetical protein
MKRKYLAASLVLGLAAAGAVAWHISRGDAEPSSGDTNNTTNGPPLPIAKVILFNSGVGYIQREGDITGDANVEMTFPTSDVNDLLKSLVLQDDSGSKVAVVSYDSQDPVDKTLRSFALDLNNNPGIGQILTQARGEKIEVLHQEKPGGNASKVSGVIIGLEVKQQPAKDGSGNVEQLNLLTQEGMLGVPLNQVQAVRFLNRVLDEEFRRALDVLAHSHDTQKKTVTLQFHGSGTRQVSVGYVVERPIWKTTYRLMLQPNGKLFMQGWAIVENVSDDDWNNVRMVLVSAKPISFRMDLYEPLYIPRPLVEPELFASLRPPEHGRPLYERDKVRLEKEQEKEAEIKKIMDQYAGLMREGKYAQAHTLALRGLDLDPENVSLTAAATIASMKMLDTHNLDVENKKSAWFDDSLDDDPGPNGSIKRPVKFDKDTGKRIQDRKSYAAGITADLHDPVERRIAHALEEKKVTVKFNNTPLDYAIRDLKALAGGDINIVFDELAMKEEGIRKDQPLSLALSDVTLRSALSKLVENAGLTWVIRNQTVTITTMKHAAGGSKAAPYSLATTEEVGEYFQYVIDQKISLPRQKSAMLPIVNQVIDGHKVSIFNARVHPKFPLLGLRLKNTSGKPLTQGPITVYDDGAYAGDTRTLDLQPNEERLLSYALDQSTEVKTESKAHPGPDMNFNLGGDNLTAGYTMRETTTYTVKNRGAHDRVLIIEHPIRASWKLVDQKSSKERSRDVYRFEIPVPANTTTKYQVVEDQQRTDPVALTQPSQDEPPSYALMDGIRVKPLLRTNPPELMSLKIVKGVVQAEYKQHEAKTYVIQNNASRDHIFTVDHIVRPGWKRLAGQGKDQVGPTVYRFKLDIKSGKTGQEEIVEERIYQDNTQAVKALDDNVLRELAHGGNMLREFASQVAPTAKARMALQQVLDQRAKLTAVQQELATRKQYHKLLVDDQARVREALKVIPPTSDHYKDFLTKFVAMEKAIETAQQSLRKTDAQLLNLQLEHEKFVTGLTVQ